MSLGVDFRYAKDEKCLELAPRFEFTVGTIGRRRKYELTELNPLPTDLYFYGADTFDLNDTLAAYALGHSSFHNGEGLKMSNRLKYLDSLYFARAKVSHDTTPNAKLIIPISIVTSELLREFVANDKPDVLVENKITGFIPLSEHFNNICLNLRKAIFKEGINPQDLIAGRKLIEKKVKLVKFHDSDLVDSTTSLYIYKMVRDLGVPVFIQASSYVSLGLALDSITENNS